MWRPLETPKHVIYWDRERCKFIETLAPEFAELCFFETELFAEISCINGEEVTCPGSKSDKVGLDAKHIAWNISHNKQENNSGPTHLL